MAFKRSAVRSRLSPPSDGTLSDLLIDNLLNEAGFFAPKIRKINISGTDCTPIESSLCSVFIIPISLKGRSNRNALLLFIKNVFHGEKSFNWILQKMDTSIEAASIQKIWYSLVTFTYLSQIREILNSASMSFATTLEI